MIRKPKVVAVIPARYQSTRFQGKPLAKILGEPMIYHVYRNIKSCKILDDLFVATDDERIVKAVEGFGGKAIMTSSDHPTGTDRVAEAARTFDADIVVNVQGDEPLLKAALIEQTVRPLLDDPKLQVTNLISRLKDLGDFVDSSVVKAALDAKGNVMYLTRAPIPFPKTRQNYTVHKQIGLYAFRKNFLLQFVKMEQTPLELVEGIEFLRILENRIQIKAVVTDYNATSVDTLSDLIEVEKILKRKK